MFQKSILLFTSLVLFHTLLLDTFDTRLQMSFDVTKTVHLAVELKRSFNSSSFKFSKVAAVLSVVGLTVSAVIIAL